MSYRYIGNKSRLAKEILREVRKIVSPGAVVADLMCGTASMSETLRCAGYRVIASDIMTFAAHHARVRLLLDSPPSFVKVVHSGYDGALSVLQQVTPFEGFIFQEYSPAGRPSGGQAPRQYFTSENAAKIDAVLRQLAQWESADMLTALEAALLRHDLVLAANRVANIAGTYGHFRSKWNKAAIGSFTLQPADIVPFCRTDHVVMQGRAEDIANGMSADVCYLDPPYMKRQYAANYHLLETLARGDTPEAIGVSGLRPWRDQYSDFCSKQRIRSAFGRIIKSMDCREFLISYSEDGLLSRQEMLDMLGGFGQVSVTEIRHQRFRSNNSPLGRDLSEYLFHLSKR